MSWTKKNVHPGKILSTYRADHSPGARGRSRRSGAFRWASSRPRTIRGKPSPPNIRTASKVEGEIKNITEFGLFIGLDGDVDGMVHLSDLDWKRPGEEAIKDYKKGDTRQGQGARCRYEKERISLGIKQLGGDPMGRPRPASRRATP